MYQEAALLAGFKTGPWSNRAAALQLVNMTRKYAPTYAAQQHGKRQKGAVRQVACC
jgi:hypothetical protein